MKLEILDVNSILYSAQHVKAISGDRVRGCPVAGIKLITRKLSYLLSTHSHVVCAFDSRTSRKLIMPEYKNGRNKSPEVILQAQLLYELLTNAGISCIKINDMEADDIIFNLVEKYRPVSFEINIHSGDMDLIHNIIDGRTKLLAVNDRSLNANYGNLVEVISEVDLRVPSNLITAKKIFLGDSSDNIGSFKSEDGRNGKTLFKVFLDFIKKYDLYDPAINRTREVFDIITSEGLALTPRDLEELKKRCDVFYPRKCELDREPCSINQIDYKYYCSMIKSLKDSDSMRTLNYWGETNTVVDEILFDYGNRFRSGEFHVDNNLSLEDEPYKFEDSSIFIRDL